MKKVGMQYRKEVELTWVELIVLAMYLRKADENTRADEIEAIADAMAKEIEELMEV